MFRVRTRSSKGRKRGRHCHIGQLAKCLARSISMTLSLGNAGRKSLENMLLDHDDFSEVHFWSHVDWRPGLLGGLLTHPDAHLCVVQVSPASPTLYFVPCACNAGLSPTTLGSHRQCVFLYLPRLVSHACLNLCASLALPLVSA